MATTAGTEEKPIDPGCLPAWNVDEMPEPKFGAGKTWLRLIGPGLVLAGGSIGTGEWIIGPQNAARYQGAFLWAVLLSILAQVILNTEVMRYTLCTGEPIMTGFLRCKPGPKFWIGLYLILDVSGWMPALAGLGAQIMVVLIKGLTPKDTIDQELVRIWSFVLFVGCCSLVLFGGKIYNTLKMLMATKFLFLLGYLTFCCLFYVSAEVWFKMWTGLVDPFRLPVLPNGSTAIDWSIVSAMAGFAGVGGMGNIMASNFVRENGWGMGSKVGAIPSAFGGHNIKLSHIGTMCRPGPETKRRFDGWFRFMIPDQYLMWFLGSLIGMMLPCMLGAQYLDVTSVKAQDNWKWAAAMAQDFGAAKGDIFRVLTLICGLVIILPGQFYTADGNARKWTDAIWSGSKRVHSMDPGKVRYIYYAIIAFYVVWGSSILVFFPKLSASTMMVIAGNLANLAITFAIFHTLYVNKRFLPKELQPSLGKQAAMVASGLFFTCMFGLVVWQKLIPALLGK